MDLNKNTLVLLQFSKYDSAESPETMDLGNDSSEQSGTPSHSRNSSTGSSVSSPFPSVFSTRTHSRWPSSASSLTGSPDSPPTVAKSALHDLLEEPAERDDELDLSAETDALNDFCLCDSIFCEHQRAKSVPGTPLESPLPSIDNVFDIPDSAFGLSTERRSSDAGSRGAGSTQRTRRFRSISNRWRQRKPISSTSAPVTGARSAPPSRSPSLRNLSWASSIVSSFHSPKLDAVRKSGGSIFDVNWEPDILDDAFFLDLAQKTMDSNESQPERSPTPLLPPLFSSLLPDGQEDDESSLPSPPFFETSTTDSPFASPPISPTSSALWSPILSPKPSTTSIRTGISLHGTDIPVSKDSGEEFDHWAIKLGHANFHISPEPYLPTNISTSNATETCLRLRADWELARVAFMKQAALIAEHYGLGSRTYALTCEKWEEVDSIWRANFSKVRAEVVEASECGSVFSGTTASGGVQSLPPDLRPLPETQAIVQMPTLKEDKFPAVDTAHFVGPMVRFDSLQASGSSQQDGGGKKGGALLRLWTDTAALLRTS